MSFDPARMPEAERAAALDVIALAEAITDGREEDYLRILNATDDAEHWRMAAGFGAAQLSRQADERGFTREEFHEWMELVRRWMLGG